MFDEVSLEETSENLILCGQALTDFLSLKIDPTGYLDIVESCEVDVIARSISSERSSKPV
ncbi:MAG: hypothetical protein EWV85_02445 [Microcystis aeruginosa Ma_QC_C_20070703_M131]|uniref:Uncharacterized protein n=1 Tax=Microcystis aeruginosa Ma_QC_C_20070703_M131 TaxID=2486263 RepID=A0A551YL36_MICAE|nr:MAG: hypothetical protein EWV85_02445 [Microcystis aeruginosa Ma_QC_C_20070703_M131]